MNILNKIKEKSHIIFIVISVLLFFNWISNCTSIKRSEEFSNKMELNIKNLQTEQTIFLKEQNILLEKKFLEFIINEENIREKKITIDSLKNKLNNTLIKLKSIEDTLK